MTTSEEFEAAIELITKALQDNLKAHQELADSLAEAIFECENDLRQAQMDFEKSINKTPQALTDVKFALGTAYGVLRRANISEREAPTLGETHKDNIKPLDGLEQSRKQASLALQAIQSRYRELESIWEDQRHRQQTRQRIFLLIFIVLTIGITGTYASFKFKAEQQKNADRTATALVVTNTNSAIASETAAQLAAEAEVRATIRQRGNLTATALSSATVVQMTAEAATEVQRNTDMTSTAVAIANATAAPMTAEAAATIQQAAIRAAKGVTTNVDWEPFTEIVDGVEMVLVPTGCFMMGSEDGEDDEKPMHEQCIEESFWIGRYEVTNAEYALFIDAGGYENGDFWTKAGWEWLQSKDITAPKNYRGFTAPNQPRVGVSWYEAMAYAAWRGCRLPTEAEWEYAARGPDGLVYPWGNEFISGDLVYSENSEGHTAEVGSNPGSISWVGTLDASGNVWEWVSTVYADYPYDAGDRRERQEGTGLRVLRGGSYRRDQDSARATFRNRYDPDFRFDGVGLRLVCETSLLD